jgi:ribosomal protein S18 acetylase RimI-like enzyme
MPEVSKYNPDFNHDDYPVSILTLNPDQWETYKALRVKALEEEPIAFEDPVEGVEKFNRRTEEEWRSMLAGKPSAGKAGNLLILVAERGNALVGGVNSIITETEEGKEALIQNVYTIKETRGKGVGKKLLLAMLDDIKNIGGIKKVKLEVFATQEAAINLYKSFGFKIVECQEKARIYNGQEIDEFIMEKILSPE